MDYHTSFSNNCGSCARRSTDRGTELCFLIDAILLRALFMGLTPQLFAADSLERHRRTFCPRTIDGLGFLAVADDGGQPGYHISSAQFLYQSCQIYFA